MLTIVQSYTHENNTQNIPYHQQAVAAGLCHDSEFCLYYGVLRIATFNLAPYMAGIYTGAV